MASFINTNTASLNAQRNLTTSQSSLTTSLQRLSSGLRINSAKDDAAGLAIASRFTSQIRGTDQAVRNANDGISLAQTAEGSLGEISNNLQRIRELAVQASNSTNSASDRAAINQEVQQRLSEIDRNASQTSFNGQKILDGSFKAANFQVGANAGESITVDLSTSMRNSATGKIASVLSSTLGASAGTNGSVKTGAIDNAKLDFSALGSADTAGKISITAGTFSFSSPTTASGGTSASQTISTNAADTNFSTPGVAQVDAKVVAGNGAAAKFDYSSTALAQFNVTIASSTTATVGITLKANYTSMAGVASEIQTQIRATAGNEAVSVGFSGGSFTFTNTGKLGAIDLANQDANASDFSANVTRSSGSPAQITSNATLTIDGTNITLNGNDANPTAVAAELTTKMQASGLGNTYSAAITSGKLVITNTAGPAVAITNVDANAGKAGFVNSVGVAGGVTTAGNVANLTVDGHALTLNSDYGSYAGLAGALATKLDAAAGAGVFKVTNTAGDIKIERTSKGASSTAVNITAADGNAQTAFSIGAAAAGTAGTYSTAGGTATFYVDGNKVDLSTNTTSGAQGTVTNLVTAMNAKFTDVANPSLAGYVATAGAGADAGKVVISKTGSTAAVNITGSNQKATDAGIAFASGTTGAAAGSISLTDFNINGIDLGQTGGKTYADVQTLATAINSSVTGVYASVSTGVLKITSANGITLAGADATGGTGFSATSVAANTGSLNSIDVTTAAGALDAIQRADSALSNVSTMRSTFGAVQNRFESVIANLSSASENLSASRSRLLDADFAAETANMTRGQILQQAGTAMLAQANSLPNGVLALLRG